MIIAFFGDSLTAGIPGVSYVDQLRHALPDHTLINYGKINDTTLSLQRRIVQKNLHRLMPVDLAFVWIGVNDVLIKRSWFFSRVRRYWAHDEAQFQQHYRLLLDTIAPCVPRLVTVSPALIGEDPENSYNCALTSRAAIIEELSGDFANVRYLDLHQLHVDALTGLPQRQDVPQNIFQALWDTFTLHTPGQVDRAAARRGLHLTLDGVHLNSVGATLAASAFRRVINDG